MNKMTITAKTHVVIALTFAALMLIISWLVGDHEKSDTVLIVLISAYVIITGQLSTKKAVGC